MEFNDVVLVITDYREAVYVNNNLYDEDPLWHDFPGMVAELSPLHFVVRDHLPSDQAYFDEHGIVPRNLADLVNYEVPE